MDLREKFFSGGLVGEQPAGSFEKLPPGVRIYTMTLGTEDERISAIAEIYQRGEMVQYMGLDMVVVKEVDTENLAPGYVVEHQGVVCEYVGGDNILHQKTFYYDDILLFEDKGLLSRWRHIYSLPRSPR